ncbi:MAG: DNA polymerase III subunit gamma/tau [Tissierellia bacterium]|nr:DNA polymerase III subunit gamma/tau [Tissierellia bacterium]
MYQALYRQYRPKTFDEVLGQEHVTTTLKNQIISGNIGHAYIFAGTKGTGKTSTAKIFSRAVNCLNPKDGNPCNECEICKGIMDESIMDVIEMDAASNRKIEDIREIRDKVIYPPSKTKYKIYIIDEVHMLTNQAFNALLKTLEEPPKHLIFILATTELQKLPSTIVSRCQRFDFKRLSSKDIIANMQNILNSLNIKVDEKILRLIARNSEGAMRDYLSLLDQLISYNSENLTYAEALEILGIANTELIFSLVDNIKNRRVEEALIAINNIIQEGKDIVQFIKDLIQHYRNLLIAKTSDSAFNIMDMDEDMIEEYKNQSSGMTLDYILKSLEVLNDSERRMAWTTHPRIILEMAIIKLTNLEERLSLEERVKRLEEILDKGKASIPINFKEGEKQVERAIKLENVQDSVKVATSQSIVESKEKEEKEEPVDIIDDGKEIPFESIKDNWTKILNIIREKDVKTNAFLKEGKPSHFSNNKLTIAFGDKFGFHKAAMERPHNKELLESVLSSYFNKNIKVAFIMENDSVEDKMEDKEDNIKDIIDFFGEDIVKIEK